MQTASFTQQRANMVEGQLRPNRINQPLVLARFANLPRESFVPAAAQPSAYLDQPISLNPTHQMYSPLVTARLVQAIQPQAADNALVVAAGTGYTTAVLAGLCQHVVAVEADATLLKQAKANLAAQDINNVHFVYGAPNHGHDTLAPYTLIIIDAPFAELPTEITAQLREGGRLAGVRIGADGVPEATLYTKHGKSLVAETLFETQGSVHPAFAASEKFVF